jgi:hypothetical protein
LHKSITVDIKQVLLDLKFRPKVITPYLQDTKYIINKCNVTKFEPEKYVFQDGLWKAPEYWYDDQSSEKAVKVPTHIRFGHPE